jgi:hypothetical protein
MSRHLRRQASTPQRKKTATKPLSYCKNILAQYTNSQRTDATDLIQSWGSHKLNIEFNIKKKIFTILSIGCREGFEASILIELVARYLHTDLTNIRYLGIDSDQQLIDQANEVYSKKSHIKFAHADFGDFKAVEEAMKSNLAGAKKADMIFVINPSIKRDSLKFHLPLASSYRVQQMERCFSLVLPHVLTANGTVLTTHSSKHEDVRTEQLFTHQFSHTQVYKTLLPHGEGYLANSRYAIMHTYAGCNVRPQVDSTKVFTSPPCDRQATWTLPRACLFFATTAVTTVVVSAYAASQVLAQEDDVVAATGLEM